MEEMEMTCFNIICNVGSAKSFYMEAVAAAKEGDFEKAESLVNEGNEAFQEGHHAHADLLVKEANGDKIPFSILLMHAEDQLMNADTFKILALEIIDLHKKLAE